MIARREVRVTDPGGFHIRPAQLFQETASKYACTVFVETESGQRADAKSILALMTLGLKEGSLITIEAEGELAEEAVESLEQLVRSNFGVKP